MAQTIESRKHAGNNSVTARARAFVSQETKNLMEERGMNERMAERVDRYGQAVGAVQERLQVHDGSRIGSYLEDIALRIDRVSDDLRRGDYRNGAREISRLAGDHPEIFIGAAFAAGAILGRTAREVIVERNGVQEQRPNMPTRQGVPLPAERQQEPFSEYSQGA